MEIRVDSKEYIYSTLTADHDLTGVDIEVALPATGVAPSTWYAATVTDVTQTSVSPERWTVTYRLLVGPSGTVTLSAGTYDWTFKVLDTPEEPVRKTGTVTVTAV